MLVGLVKWFDGEKGFGVVDTIAEGEFFLHVNSFFNKPLLVTPGTAIVFRKRVDTRKKRNSVENCRLVGQQEDWKLLMNYLDKADIINVQMSHNNRRGEALSLMQRGAEQIYRTLGAELALLTITGYFEQYYDQTDFIIYCSFLEKSITKYFTATQAAELLSNVFDHFGNSLDEIMLFNVWKQRKFHFIGRWNAEEYEIPESTIRTFSNLLEVPDLSRIKAFSYGQSFCKEYLQSKFRVLAHLSADELVPLYALLEVADDQEKENYTVLLTQAHATAISGLLREAANKLGKIETDADYRANDQLKGLIHNTLPDSAKVKLQAEISQLIIERSAPAYLPELWLKGLLPSFPISSVSAFYLNPSISEAKRTAILRKLQWPEQLSQLIRFAGVNGWPSAFREFRNLVIAENDISSYYFNFQKALFDDAFWEEHKGKELKAALYMHVDANVDDENKLLLFLNGWIEKFPCDYVLRRISGLSVDDISKILYASDNISFKYELLRGKIPGSEFSELCYVYELAKSNLDKDTLLRLDQYTFSVIDRELYYKLWLLGEGKIFPADHIGSLFDHKEQHYKQIATWLNDKIVAAEAITDLLHQYLQQKAPVTDRIIFFKQFYHIKYLLLIDPNGKEKVIGVGSNFYLIILWFLDYKEDLDFDQLKYKFIYFLPEQQVRILRKLFYMKAKGHFELTIEKLQELTRFDLDLYKLQQELIPSIPIDISTDVVIQALSSFSQKGCFLVENELLKTVLHGLKDDRHHRFKLAHYFEPCAGRYLPDFRKNEKGEISKIYFGDGKFYFAISFPTGSYQRVRSKWGDREEFVPNPDFGDLKNATKKLPGAKWNPTAAHWGIPSQYESAVLQFAEQFRFRINFPDNPLADNLHLVVFNRREVPNGISFCEGRASNKLDTRLKREFWWCNGLPCYQKCESIHSPQEWEHYTLLDFCMLLGFDINERNGVGDLVDKGHYYKFISLINRFNRLLERLYCDSCNEILFPVEIANYASYNVVRFRCANQSCPEKKEVYLNHCLNGQCNSIIDSRISGRCPNGLHICDRCGSCCSHSMLSRRLDNLEKTGGYIHDDLRRCVDHKLGHQERAEYFCHSCTGKMLEIELDVFQCHKCNITYDTRPFKFKRLHRHLNSDQDKSAHI